MCVQEDMLVALSQGGRLLESINEPIARDPDHNMNQDEMENLATVQRSEQPSGWRVFSIYLTRQFDTENRKSFKSGGKRLDKPSVHPY